MSGLGGWQLHDTALARRLSPLLAGPILQQRSRHAQKGKLRTTHAPEYRPPPWQPPFPCARRTWSTCARAPSQLRWGYGGCTMVRGASVRNEGQFRGRSGSASGRRPRRRERESGHGRRTRPWPPTATLRMSTRQPRRPSSPSAAAMHAWRLAGSYLHRSPPHHSSWDCRENAPSGGVEGGHGHREPCSPCRGQCSYLRITARSDGLPTLRWTLGGACSCSRTTLRLLTATPQTSGVWGHSLIHKGTAQACHGGGNWLQRRRAL